MARVRLCEVCKKAMEPERLEASGDTRLCLLHAKKIEAFGGEFITKAVQERTSKSGSLKLNYGGIETTRQRNHAAIERLKDEYLAETSE